MNECVREYYGILSSGFPAFLKPYLELPLLKRLAGVGLLCGTDWTNLYQNKFFYSRLDHSVGVALIVWNFTKSREQALAALLHDVSSPVFSHVADFRKGDALTQEATEEDNAGMICADEALRRQLDLDGIAFDSVVDYHHYPIADNDLPGLAADRLEYMFMTGYLMREDIWSMADIRRCYDDIVVLKNEQGVPELGFRSREIAELYCQKCCQTGLIMLQNENKLALSLLAEITRMAISLGCVTESDFFRMTEKEMISCFEEIVHPEFRKYYRLFRNMRKIERSDAPLSGHYSVSVEVKRRYIDPLCGEARLSAISEQASGAIAQLLHFRDARYANVPF